MGDKQIQSIQTDEVLTLAEVAEHFKVSKRTVLTWIKVRDMPAHKLGPTAQSILRFSRAEIDEWFRNLCFATSGDAA